MFHLGIGKKEYVWILMRIKLITYIYIYISLFYGYLDENMYRGCYCKNGIILDMWAVEGYGTGIMDDNYRDQ